ncbi:uncharacterized protein B4U79_02859 [Dinothrombium tinctorium]|uniref:Glycosyltransferase family 92 protein n=1 Tax=Dinothrombium tinctorium TaxID=1965070 RepID=A0A443R9Z7_9ACAR|nr:uncharacterized protein B4U79_02859 [Dinothrombium tinctorium]
MTIETVTDKRYSSFYVDELDDNDVRADSRRQAVEKEIGLPPQVSRELEKILSEDKYSGDLFGPNSLFSASSPPPDTAFNSSIFTGDTWQNVAGAKDKFFVFSAFYDDRNPKIAYIRVIAATLTRNSEQVKCKLWYNNPHKAVLVKAVNKPIRENWNLKYSAYFVFCILGDHEVPDAVSVVAKNKTHSNHLIVHNHPRTRRLLEANAIDFAVCVKPLHYEYNNVTRLIEFIEFNRLLGVSHFILYNHTIGSQVDCLLREYIRKGLVSVLQWQLDIKSQKEIRTEGLFASLNDCLYRTMFRFKFVLMIDLDEYIVPHLDRNLTELIHRLSALNSNYYRRGAYSFQNAFFYLQWPDDSSQVNRSSGQSRISNSLITLLKTRRKEKLHIHKQRSKLIVAPQRVVEVGNHFVWEFVPKYTVVNVSPRVAFLHHYRICEYGGDDCVKTASVVDKRTHFWKSALIESVEKLYKNFTLQCNEN